VLGKLVNVPTEMHLQLRPILAGLGAGILTTLLFTLPPLLDIRNVKPSLILRRDTETEGPADTPSLLKQILGRLPWVLLALVFTVATSRFQHRHWPSHMLAQILEYVCLFAAAGVGPWLVMKTRKNPAQVVSFLAILAGLAAIATTLSDSPAVGEAFSVGLVLVLLVLLAAATTVLAGLKFFLNRTRLHLPSALRHGLANLYRPGNPSAALLAALGMGIMQIMTVYLVQRAVVADLHTSAAPNRPNVFLIDIANNEIDGVRHLLKAQPGVIGEPELIPVVSGRVAAIDGVSAAQAKLSNFPRRMLRSISLTWADAAPPGTKVTAGEWWSPDESQPEVAIAQQQATRLGVKVGSVVTFAVQDKQIDATVVALTRADGQHAYSRADFFLNRKALAGLPVIWDGGIHIEPEQVSQIQRALYAAYPTITIINVAQTLETVRAVVIQITYVIQFLAGFSIFAGIIILASSIAGTKYRRIREVVVLKTLGATRSRIATIFSIEFAVLGLVSGLVGIVFANIIARALLHQLNLQYEYQVPLNLAALLGTATLTVITGWIASHRILGQKPLEVLREE
jgi:putative ABC transport system permease protein